MISTVGSIDTDAGIGTILGNFNSEFISHVIDDSLQMKFRPFDYNPMPNMVDILERQFLSISNNSLDYRDQVAEVRIETYKEIILKICAYYNLEFVGDLDGMFPEEIYGIARTLYEIFISKFTPYLNDFFVSYIVNNADSIYAYLQLDETAIKPKETGLYNPKNYVDPKFIAIHANVNKVVMNMGAYDIPLQSLLNYFLNPEAATRIGSLIADRGDIYKNYYASYIYDQRYQAGVLTNIKLSLQTRTQEAIKL